jgi:hypothetical protein
VKGSACLDAWPEFKRRVEVRMTVECRGCRAAATAARREKRDWEEGRVRREWEEGLGFDVWKPEEWSRREEGGGGGGGGAGGGGGGGATGESRRRQYRRIDMPFGGAFGQSHPVTRTVIKIQTSDFRTRPISAMRFVTLQTVLYFFFATILHLSDFGHFRFLLYWRHLCVTRYSPAHACKN